MLIFVALSPVEMGGIINVVFIIQENKLGLEALFLEEYMKESLVWL